MATDAAALAQEIARLEAELERARVESQKQHRKADLHAELTTVENVLDEDEYMVIKDLIDDAGEEEYVEYTEHSYDEYEEDYIDEDYSEEYEEVVDDSSEYEEIVEEAVEPASAPVQGSARPALNQLVNAQSTLRKTEMSARQQKEKEEAEAAKEAAKARAAQPPKAAPAPVVKKEKKPVRAPPSKGGKPIPRKEIEVAKKPPKKNPLSRLLLRNSKSAPSEAAEKPANEPVEAAPALVAKEAPKQIAPKKKMVRKVIKKPGIEAPKKGAASSATGPFKRRIIPNTQPSPPGEESIFEQLLGPKLITNPKLHKCSTKGCVKDQELVCLYFAAKWKSDCKRFNPLLKDFYYNVAQQNNLEVVYISADRSLMEFKDCYTTMPYLAMPAGTTSLKNELTKALKVIEMPALVVLNDEGMVVSVQGVQKIMELEKGNVKQAQELVDRWKKTRPIPISEVQKDETLLHGTMDRGTLYWN